VLELIQYHDTDVCASHKSIRRWLNRIGEERYRQLLQVKIADAMAQTPEIRQERRENIENVMVELDKVIEQEQCFSLKDLAINGRDLMALGVSEGAEVGRVLNQLLDSVINESTENNRTELLKAAEALLS